MTQSESKNAFKYCVKNIHFSTFIAITGLWTLFVVQPALVEVWAAVPEPVALRVAVAVEGGVDGVGVSCVPAPLGAGACLGECSHKRLDNNADAAFVSYRPDQGRLRTPLCSLRSSRQSRGSQSCTGKRRRSRLRGTQKLKQEKGKS